MADKEWGADAAEWLGNKQKAEAARLEHENNCRQVTKEQTPKLFSELTKWITQQIEQFNARQNNETLECSRGGRDFSVFTTANSQQRRLVLSHDQDPPGILYRFVKGGNEEVGFSLMVTVTSDWRLVFSTLQGQQRSIPEVGTDLLNELIGRK